MSVLNSRIVQIGLILIGFTLNLLFGATAEETFKKRVPLHGGGYIYLENSNGRIEVNSWDREEVEIIAFKKVRAGDRDEAQRLLDKLEIDVSTSGNEVEIITETPNKYRNSGFFSWLFGGGWNESYSVQYELRVPRKVEMNLKTTNGTVRIEDVSGRFSLKTTNGKIVADKISGVIRCKTTNGPIKVFLEEVTSDDEMRFHTTNGSITVYLPEDFGGEVDLKTTNGSIQTDFPLQVKSGYSKKSIRGLINDGIGSIECRTTNGSIRLLYND